LKKGYFDEWKIAVGEWFLSIDLPFVETETFVVYLSIRKLYFGDRQENY